MNRKIIIFSAPSGSGKSTLINHLLSVKELNLSHSVSATSRMPRKGEIEGKSYYFVSKATFLNQIKENGFIEYEEVYGGFYYGTYKSEINRLWVENKNIICDIDVKGARRIKDKYKENALMVFIKPPSIEELKHRLIKRNTDNIKNIINRLNRAKEELSFQNEYDVVIENDNLQKTKEKVEKLIRKLLIG